MNKPVKTYPPRGGMFQIRFMEPVEFRCSQCGGNKKSKSVATYVGDESLSRKLCNGCYGQNLRTEEA